MAPQKTFTQAADPEMEEKQFNTGCYSLNGSGWKAELKQAMVGVIAGGAPDFFDPLVMERSEQSEQDKRMTDSLNHYVTQIYNTLSARGADSYDAIAAAIFVQGHLEGNNAFPNVDDVIDFVKYDDVSKVGIKKPKTKFIETEVEHQERLKARKVSLEKQQERHIEKHGHAKFQMTNPAWEQRRTKTDHGKLAIGYEVPKGFDRVLTGSSYGMKNPMSVAELSNAIPPLQQGGTLKNNSGPQTPKV